MFATREDLSLRASYTEAEIVRYAETSLFKDESISDTDLKQEWEAEGLSRENS